MARLIPIAHPAFHALRRGWRHALLVALVGAVAVTVLVALNSLTDPAAPTGTVLATDAVAEAGPTVAWTEAARTPEALRRAALADLFTLLAVLAWTTFAVGAGVILMRSLAHGAGRAPEFGIRRAVGASRRVLAAGLLLEAAAVTVVLLVAGIGAGWAITNWATDAWPGTPAAPVLAPWKAAALATVAVAAAWLTGLRFARGRYLSRPADATVPLWIPTTQMAVAVAVLTAAGLVWERGRALTTSAAAADRGVVLTLDTSHVAPAERATRYHTLLARLRDDPDVALASLSAPGGVLGLGTVDAILTECGNCPGPGGTMVPWRSADAIHYFAAPDTFAASGARVVAGRALTLDDTFGGARVVLVNRHVAGRYFERGDAVGRGLFLRHGFWREPYTVVGVVDDDRAPVLGGAGQPREAVYVPALLHPPARAELLIRTRPDAPADSIERLRLVAAGILGSGILTGMAREADLLGREARLLRWFGAGFALVGFAALAIALAGVLGTTRLWVRSLGFELALRRAVGGSRRRVAGSVIARAGFMALAGVALGALAFLVLLKRPLTALVPDVSLLAPGVLWPVGAVFAVAAMSAALSALRPLLTAPPARRLH